MQDQPPAIIEPMPKSNQTLKQGDITFSFAQAAKPILIIYPDGKITTEDGTEIKDLSHEKLLELVEKIVDFYCKGCLIKPVK